MASPQIDIGQYAYQCLSLLPVHAGGQACCPYCAEDITEYIRPQSILYSGQDLGSFLVYMSSIRGIKRVFGLHPC